MLADERQNMISEFLRKNGAVTVSALVKKFNVSAETVRRDLLAMENRGQLVRVHGGAVTRNGMKPYSNLESRNKQYFDLKTELSLKAAEFINEDDVIAVDTGSTAISLAEAIKEKFTKLTVVTHSEDVFEILRGVGDISVILCGGHYMRGENSFYGDLTLGMLGSIHVAKSFVFPSAVSLKYGIFVHQKELYQIQKKLINIANEVYILADSSKYEKTALLKIDNMRTEYTYITDSKLKDELVKLYQENEINIYLGG